MIKARDFAELVQGVSVLMKMKLKKIAKKNNPNAVWMFNSTNRFNIDTEFKLIEGRFKIVESKMGDSSKIICKKSLKEVHEAMKK